MDIDVIPFTINNLRKQYFAVPKLLRKYMIKNATAKLFRKLYKTCKYFYLKSPYFIVDVIDFYWPKNIPIPDKRKKTNLYDVNRLPFIENIWVTNYISIKGTEEVCNDLICEIVRCDATHLEGNSSTITKDDFVKLANFGTIQNTCFYKVKVLDDYGSKVPIEDLLTLLLPNALAIEMDNCHVTPKTIDKLLRVKQKWKLNKFCLRGLDAEINMDQFFEFIKRRCISNAEIDIRFNYENSYKFSLNFTETINSKIDEEEKVDEPVAKRRKLENDPTAKYALYVENLKAKRFPLKPIGSIAYQNFGVRQPILNYIIKYANARVMLKLQKTCKLLYTYKPLFIVDLIQWNFSSNPHVLKFELNQNEEDVLEVYSFNQIKNIRNIWITDSLILFNHEDNPISEIIPRIAKCDAETFWLTDVNISLNEFNILTESGNVIDWNTERCHILDDEGYLVSAGYIISKLPKAWQITIYPCNFNDDTEQELEALPTNNIIEKLHLLDIDSLVGSEIFFKFIRKVVSPEYSEIRLVFDEDEIEDEDDIEEFKTDIQMYLESWDEDEAIPSLKFVTWDEWIKEMGYD